MLGQLMSGNVVLCPHVLVFGSSHQEAFDIKLRAASVFVLCIQTGLSEFVVDSMKIIINI